MNKWDVLNKIKGGLIVSCQALKSEPLFSSYIMGRMAVAAKEGGAVGIRANTAADIIEIKKNIDLPVIGLVKSDYPDSEIYITPTMKEIDELAESGCEIIAMDATDRVRPEGVLLEQFFNEVKSRYPHFLYMADTACFEEGKKAEELGFDLIGTTLAGYTENTRGQTLPAYDLMERYVKELHTPVIGEGGIWETEQLKRVKDLNVFSYVIGTAITRPRDITRRFVECL